MKGISIKSIISTTLVTVLTVMAIPTILTPVKAEELECQIYCEVATDPNGILGTTCYCNIATDDYVDNTTPEEQAAEELRAQQEFEADTGLKYEDYEGTPYKYVPTITRDCSIYGFSSDYYWSFRHKECVTDNVVPTIEPTLEPLPDPVGGEYYTFYKQLFTNSGLPYDCTISGRYPMTTYERVPADNGEGYKIVEHYENFLVTTTCNAPVDNNVQASSPTPTPTVTPVVTTRPTATPKPTVKPTSTPIATPKPTVKPTSTPIATPKPTVKPTSTPITTTKPTVKPTSTPIATSTANQNYEQVLQDAIAQYNKGSLGFFESIGATDAQSILNGTYDNSKLLNKRATVNYETALKYTNIGATGDATSLENMLAALDTIQRINALRKEEGVPELQITNSLMAMSQIQNNASAYTPTGYYHTETFRVGENLAKVHGINGAIDGWYTQEKVNYETNNGGQTGHYENIVSNTATITGAAVTQNGMNGWTSFEQTFGAAYADNYTHDTKYSSTEYYNLFMEYYNQLNKTIEEAKQHLNN